MNNRILDFYGFSALPFSKDIAPKDVFSTSAHKEALGMLGLAVAKEDIVLLTGEVGIGKSVVLRSFLHELDENKYTSLYVRGPNLSPGELYKIILSGLHIPPPHFKEKAKMVFFQKIPELKRKPVVVIDDAQEMHDRTLSELKSLVNFSFDSSNQITIILSGQPELVRRLKMDHLCALRQRIRLSSEMAALGLDECARYIDHHIKLVVNKKLFSEEAKADIFKKTNGVPRKINSICFMTLIQGMIKKLSVIDSHDICVPPLLED
jgi:general secretion pathway protein A